MNHLMPKKPARRELAIAAAVAVAWGLAGFAVAALLDEPARGATSAPVDAHPAVCRVSNRLPDGATNIGSGTLVDVTADRGRGLVLTCAHLFTEGRGRVVVEFPGARSHGALLVAIDAAADLAALEIANPRAAPVAVAADVASSARLRACGFGPQGVYQSVEGQVVGAAASSGRTSVKLSGAVRSGDSGGGVFDEAGRLVGVVWGEAGGVTYASSGEPLRRFTGRLLGREPGIANSQFVATPAACPNGQCPRVIAPAPWAAPYVSPTPRPATPAASTSPAGNPVAAGCPCGPQLADLRQRLDAIQQTKQDRGDYVSRADLAALARTDHVAQLDAQSRERHQTILGRLESLAAPGAGAAGRAAGVAATTALDISGPVGWGVLAGTSVGGWLLGRWLARRKRGVGGRRGERFQE
jgi:hypothetical protein